MKRLLTLPEEKDLSKVVNAVLNLFAASYKAYTLPHESTAKMQVAEEVKLERKKDKARVLILSEAMRYIEEYNHVPSEEELWGAMKKVTKIESKNYD